MVGVSRSLLDPDWPWPVHGLRHPAVADHSGWYCWTGDLLSDVDFFFALHQRHLIGRIQELAELFELAPGSGLPVLGGSGSPRCLGRRFAARCVAGCKMCWQTSAAPDGIPLLRTRPVADRVPVTDSSAVHRSEREWLPGP